MSLDEFNGVRSNIYDTPTEMSYSDASRTRTFIFGTAKQGPRHTPVSPIFNKPETTFGDVPTDASFETSLVRGFYEFARMVPNNPDVALIRVGDIAAASISLYENKYITSGDLSFTEEDDLPAMSMWLRAVNEGEEYNAATVDVTEDDEGFPVHFQIDLPDGTQAAYNLSRTPGAPGVASSVSELVALINANANLQGKVYAGYDALEKSYDLTITESGSVVDRIYDIAPAAGELNASWGDKMIAISEAYIEKEIVELADAGDVSFEFEVAPLKDLDGPDALSQFIRVSELEEILSVSAGYAGRSDITANLFCKTVVGWDNSYSIAGNVDHDWTFALYVKRNGSTTYTQIENSDGTMDGDKFTLDATAGTVVLHETLSVGDRWFASYRYEVSYSEAKLRSELVSGSDRSYFIYGDQVIFGAAQPTDVYIYYTTRVPFDDGDIDIIDARTATIEFKNAANLPDAGDTVTIVYTYEPELPAATGKVLGTGVTQPGSFSGGSDGRLLSKKDYLKAVKTAMQAVELYPRKQIIVMGLHLDDTETGPNEETGLPESKPTNWFTTVLPYVERASNFVSECSLMIPVRPLTSLTQDSINAWLEKLMNNSSSDLNRPANIIDSIDNFRADVPLGVFVVSIPEVLSGRRYFANPACILGGQKSTLSFKESMTNRALPGSINDLGVKIFNAEVIGKLNQKRYTTAVVDYNGRYVWADAPTLGVKNYSQFDRQFVRDGVYYAVELARSVAQPYIGKPRLPEFLTKLRLDINKALDSMVPDFLSSFFVQIVPVADGFITGKTKFRLLLTTAKEIRQVILETYVRLAE